NYQGDFSNAFLYDSTCVEATKTFVSKIHTVMCPPQVQWGFLEVDVHSNKFTKEEVHDAQMFLNEYMRKLFRYIHKSNFDVVANEAFFDMAIGTSNIVCNPYTDSNPLLYTSIPVDQLAIEEAL